MNTISEYIQKRKVTLQTFHRISFKFFTYIFLENDNDAGAIILSTCECPMGQFRCHHVAAALLFG